VELDIAILSGYILAVVGLLVTIAIACYINVKKRGTARGEG
jgi:hypothetical protein